MPRRKAQPEPVKEPEVIYSPLEDILADRFSRYSKHIIQERALPDARDGLKPVQRRILWAMFEARNTFDHPYHKSAKTVGNVIGNYHPHGDASVYDALIRMSQDWKIRTPLVDVQGNNGSIDDDPAAAMRYTEARLSKLAGTLLEDIDKETVTWTPNFSDEKMEPTVLPARYPNLLVNGISGIAAGYATNIPPHNLEEVLDASIYRVKHPDSTLDELMQFVKGPDFPTGGIAMGLDGIKKAFETGKGKVMVRGKAEIVPSKTMQQIVITEIPYEVVKSSLVKKIDEIFLQKKVDGILDVRDESGRDGLRIVIDLKKESNASAILDYLYKNTDLQTAFNYNVIAIVNKSPVAMGLADMLDAFLAHREEVVINRTQFTLNAKNKRNHIVEGLVKATSILDEIIALIKASENKADSKRRLMEKYGFTEAQAEAIVMLQLYRLSNTDIVSLQQEKEQLLKDIRELEAILSDKEVRHNLIVDELQEMKQEFALPRKTKIVDEVEQIVINERDMVANEDFIMAFTREGYLKKSSLRSYNSSNSILPGLRENDSLIAMGQLNSMDTLAFITSRGRVFQLPVYKIEESRWKEPGIHLSSLIRLEPNEKIIDTVKLEKNGKQQLIFITQKGLVNRLDLESIPERLTSYMNLDKDDRVVSAWFEDGKEKEIILATLSGKAHRVKLDEFSIRTSRSKGVSGIKLAEDDHVVAALPVESEELLLVNTNNELKKIPARHVVQQARATVGNLILKKGEELKTILPFDEKLSFFQEEPKELSPSDLKSSKVNGKSKAIFKPDSTLYLLKEPEVIGSQPVS